MSTTSDVRGRTFLLLRHAKSDHPADVCDHDRPLTDRGVREAGLAGDWLRAAAPPVDAVLCSTATRTRDTLARVPALRGEALALGGAALVAFHVPR